jgi:hypothetical protein
MKHTTTTTTKPAPRAPSFATLGAAQHHREQTAPNRPAPPRVGNMRKIESALMWAHLVPLSAATAPAVKTTRPAPAVTVKTAHPAQGPVPAVKAAAPAGAGPGRFAHLAAVRIAGPVYTAPPPQAAVAPKESGTAIEKRLHQNMQAALPLRQQRR